MSKGIKGLVSSKKFLGLVAGIVVIVGSFFGLDKGTSQALAMPITGMVMAYLVSQGIADFGKGSIQARLAPPEMPSIPPALASLMGAALNAAPTLDAVSEKPTEE